MTKIASRHIAFGLAVAVLLAAALAAWIVDRRIDAARREFQVDSYRATMARIDAAVAAISAHMVFEGTSTDIADAAAAAQDAAGDLEPLPLDESQPEPVSGVVMLTGIIWSERQPVALINGEMMRPGAAVAGSRLVEIREDSVVMRDPSGQRRVITLYAE